MIGNNFKLIIKAEAKADIIHATKWYSDIEQKLAFGLVDELDYIFKTIRYNPKTYKKVYKNFR